jgi:hypothetical protein
MRIPLLLKGFHAQAIQPALPFLLPFILVACGDNSAMTIRARSRRSSDPHP